MSDSLSAPVILQMVEVQLALFLALLLLLSAGHKLRRPTLAGRAVAALTGLDAMPLSGKIPLTGAMRLSILGAVAAALGEGVAASMLVLPTHRVAGAALAAVIWSGYLVLLLRAVLAGRTLIDCGCSFGNTNRPLGSFQLARTLGLAVLAVLVAGLAYLTADVDAYAAPTGAATVASAATAATNVSACLAALTLLGLYGALDRVMSLTPLRTGKLP
jgi:hypothetical protein